MGYARTLQQSRRCFAKSAAIIAVLSLVVSPCFAQSAPAVQQPKLPWGQELKKYPGLLEEFGRLVENLQRSLHFPAARPDSRILPLLPESTTTYAAFPNYGDVVNQTLLVFRQELQESSVLRDWWQHSEMATSGPKLEDSLEKFAQLQQYLGEEVVVSGAVEGRESSLLVVAEVRKPGIKKFLQELLAQHDSASQSGLRVLDPQELAVAKDAAPSQKLSVLVRADYVVAALDLATLRRVNARLESNSREFVSTPFGKRVLQEYEGGVTTLAAADLRKILQQIPPATKQDAAFQRSGFADVKYLIWDHKTIDGKPVSQTELSFNAKRYGAAAWLAKPAPLTNLDFVSPNAIFAGTMVLTSPSQIFEDLKDFYSTSNTSPFATLASFEKMLQLSLKDDLLHYLGGEITVELDDLTPSAKVWKAILNVNDAERLQKTLAALMASGHLQTQHFDDAGVTYYTLQIPSGKATQEIGYAFVDGHLIVASSREAVADAVRVHESGQSLAKSPKLLASIPPGHSLDSSLLFYQDATALSAMTLRKQAPEMADALARFSRGAAPSVVGFYADDNAIREASKGGGFDVGTALVIAAVAIPNLLRSKMAANESAAVGSVRTVNTAQIVYMTSYPKRGFAPDLATLGPASRNPKADSPDHAGLISETLANESCTADAWCTKSGFHFRVTAVCKLRVCKEYVIVATPVDVNTGRRSFCSISDGVVRSRTGAPLAAPVSVSECKAWAPLQ